MIPGHSLTPGKGGRGLFTSAETCTTRLVILMVHNAGGCYDFGLAEINMTGMKFVSLVSDA